MDDIDAPAVFPNQLLLLIRELLLSQLYLLLFRLCFRFLSFRSRILRLRCWLTGLWLDCRRSHQLSFFEDRLHPVLLKRQLPFIKLIGWLVDVGRRQAAHNLSGRLVLGKALFNLLELLLPNMLGCNSFCVLLVCLRVEH